MHLIWKPRCDEVVRLEKYYNIDKKQKKLIKSVTGQMKGSHVTVCHEISVRFQ